MFELPSALPFPVPTISTWSPICKSPLSSEGSSGSVGSSSTLVKLSSSHQPKSPSVLYGCKAPGIFLVIVVCLSSISPAGSVESLLTYIGPFKITSSPISNSSHGPGSGGVGSGPGSGLPPSIISWTSSGKYIKPLNQ